MYIYAIIFLCFASGFCPTVFDGWSCVGATPAGEKAVFSCPNFTHLFFYPESKKIFS